MLFENTDSRVEEIAWIEQVDCEDVRSATTELPQISEVVVYLHSRGYAITAEQLFAYNEHAFRGGSLLDAPRITLGDPEDSVSLTVDPNATMSSAAKALGFPVAARVRVSTLAEQSGKFASQESTFSYVGSPQFAKQQASRISRLISGDQLPVGFAEYAGAIEFREPLLPKDPDWAISTALKVEGEIGWKVALGLDGDGISAPGEAALEATANVHAKIQVKGEGSIGLRVTGTDGVVDATDPGFVDFDGGAQFTMAAEAGIKAEIGGGYSFSHGVIGGVRFLFNSEGDWADPENWKNAGAFFEVNQGLEGSPTSPGKSTLDTFKEMVEKTEVKVGVTDSHVIAGLAITGWHYSLGELLDLSVRLGWLKVTISGEAKVTGEINFERKRQPGDALQQGPMSAQLEKVPE